MEAGIGAGDSRLHLIGHSHGAKVATVATARLEGDGIQVAHLTLLDSPESSVGPDNWYDGSYNNLDILLATLDIGAESAQTFVDNYFSIFGRRYGDDGAINVELNPDVIDALPGPSHAYPVEWYAKTTALRNGFALGWSPLVGGHPSELDVEYFQPNVPGFPPSHELVSRDDVERFVRGLMQRDFLGTPIGTEGQVDLFGGGAIFYEHSPSYWDSLFVLHDGDLALSVDYEFLAVGDGDILGIWIDDSLRFVIAGSVVGTGVNSTVIDLSDLEIGSHTLTIALHSVGASNAVFQVSNLRILSVVPEPSSVYGLVWVIALVTCHSRSKRRLLISDPLECCG
jgi:hypothetical protein